MKTSYASLKSFRDPMLALTWTWEGSFPSSIITTICFLLVGDDDVASKDDLEELGFKSENSRGFRLVCGWTSTKHHGLFESGVY